MPNDKPLSVDRAVNDMIDPMGNPTNNQPPATRDKAAPAGKTAPTSMKDLEVIPDDNVEVIPEVKDAKEETEITMDDFKKVTEDVNNVIEKKEDKKLDKATPDKKIEAKPEEDKEKPVTQHDKKEDDKRDYSDVPDDLKPIFKRLNNDPFNVLKPIVKERAELKSKLAERDAEVEKLKKGGLPDNYYEHEQSYVLTPEFGSAARDVSNAELVMNYWKSQYDKVRKGESNTYTDLMQDANGNFVEGRTIAVDASTGERLEKTVNWAQNQLINAQLSVRQIAEGHKAKTQDAVKQIKDFENTAFANFGGENAKIVDPIVRDIITKQLPPAFHNNALSPLLGKALFLISKLGDRVKELQTANPAAAAAKVSKDGKKIDPKDKKEAGPTSDDAVGGGASGADKDEVTMDDFAKVKEGY